MKLRKLEKKDAQFMLEWMHDPFVVKYMLSDFKNKTISECYDFIKDAKYCEKNLHMAIANDYDEYMGTVSLKNITSEAAEFAITIRKIAMGTGLSQYAMEQILKIGFKNLKLKSIFWFVLPENKRAIRFYDKNGYHKVNFDSIQCYLGKRHLHKDIYNYIWYEINICEYG